jgi:hypothetical protein
MIQTRYYITGYITLIQKFNLLYNSTIYNTLLYFYYTISPAAHYSWRPHRQVWESRRQPTSRKEGAQKGLTPHPARVPQRERVRLPPQQGVQVHLKGKCALGPFLSILVIECQHKVLKCESMSMD